MEFTDGNRANRERSDQAICRHSVSTLSCGENGQISVCFLRDVQAAAPECEFRELTGMEGGKTGQRGNGRKVG